MTSREPGDDDAVWEDEIPDFSPEFTVRMGELRIRAAEALKVLTFYATNYDRTYCWF